MTLGLLVTPATGITAQPNAEGAVLESSLTGSWVLEGREPERIVLVVGEDARVHLWWGTAGGAGWPGWLSGVGQAKEGLIEFPEVRVESGAPEGDAPPEAVQRRTWGRLTLRFSSCDAGEAQWRGPLGVGEGRVGLRRELGFLAGRCGEEAPALSDEQRRQLSTEGGWTSPERQGAVVVLARAERRSASFTARLYWFTFDSTGAPAWAFGDGQGSTLTKGFELQRARAADTAARAPTRAATDPGSAGAADDAPWAQFVLGDSVQRWGFAFVRWPATGRLDGFPLERTLRPLSVARTDEALDPPR